MNSSAVIILGIIVCAAIYGYLVHSGKVKG